MHIMGNFDFSASSYHSIQAMAKYEMLKLMADIQLFLRWYNLAEPNKYPLPKMIRDFVH